MTSSLMPSNVDLSTMSTDLEKCLRWPAKDPVWFMPTYPGHDVQTCRPPCVSSQRLPWPPVSSESTFPPGGRAESGVGDRTAWHRNAAGAPGGGPHLALRSRRQRSKRQSYVGLVAEPAHGAARPLASDALSPHRRHAREPACAALMRGLVRHPCLRLDAAGRRDRRQRRGQRALTQRVAPCCTWQEALCQPSHGHPHNPVARSSPPRDPESTEGQAFSSSPLTLVRKARSGSSRGLPCQIPEPPAAPRCAGKSAVRVGNSGACMAGRA